MQRPRTLDRPLDPARLAAAAELARADVAAMLAVTKRAPVRSHDTVIDMPPTSQRPSAAATNPEKARPNSNMSSASTGSHRDHTSPPRGVTSPGRDTDNTRAPRKPRVIEEEYWQEQIISLMETVRRQKDELHQLRDTVQRLARTLDDNQRSLDQSTMSFGPTRLPTSSNVRLSPSFNAHSMDRSSFDRPSFDSRRDNASPPGDSFDTTNKLFG